MTTTAPVRSWVATTPGRMRVLSTAAVAAIILLGVVSLGAVGHRRSAVSGLAGHSEPSVLLAQRIQSELSDADSSAANGFLAGGVEPLAQVQRYQAGLAAAADDLVQAASGSGAGASVRTISEQLATYSGLVQTASADNRQGFPVGAAYLRSATGVLRTQILPAAASLAQGSARDTRSRAGAATAGSDVLAVLGVTLLAAALLILTQVFVARRTRRAINIGLALATVAVVVVGWVDLAGMAAERTAVRSAYGSSYASSADLAQAEVLAYQARGDESQALIAQGTGQAYEADFDAAAGRVRTLLTALPSTRPTPAALQALDAAGPALADYVQLDRTIRADDAAGRHADAVSLAVGAGALDANAVFGGLETQLAAGLSSEQAAFSSEAATAHHRLGVLPVVAVIGVLLAAILALAGIQPRIDEYR